MKMEGTFGSVTLPVEVKTTEVVPGRRISGVFVNGLEGHFDWEFDSNDETTWVVLSAEYTLPPSVAGQVRDRRAMDHELCVSMQKALASMKSMVESQAKRAA